MQAQLAAKCAVVAVTWTPARVRDLTAMERSISYTLQKVGRPRITLKSEQNECIEHMYEGKDVIVWLPTGFGESLFREVLSLLTKNARGKLSRSLRHGVHTHFMNMLFTWADVLITRMHECVPGSFSSPRKEPGYEAIHTPCIRWRVGPDYPTICK